MRLIVTALIFLAGIVYLIAGLGFLLDPTTSGGGFGLEAVDTRGLAAMRADFTAFFVVSALCMMWGAWKRNGTILLVPAALFGIAFFGRAISAVFDGTVDNFWFEMMIEALTVALMLIGHRVLPHRETGSIVRREV